MLVDSRAFAGSQPVQGGAYYIPNCVTDTVCLGYGNEELLGPHCRVLSIPRLSQCQTEERAGAYLLGYTTGGVFVCRKCLCNAHNALCNRHGTAQPAPVRDLSADDVVLPFLRVLAPTWAEAFWHPMWEDACWLAKWAIGKRASFVNSRMFDAILPARVKAMVKWEVYSTLPTKARLIQFYRNLATQSLFGPEFTAVQKVVCARMRNADMGCGIDVTFASGMRADEISDWMNGCICRGVVAWYERDGERWDSTMGPTHARAKERLYACFDNKWTAFVQACNKVKAFMRVPAGIFRYSVDYTVKSGHNDTTLGNSIVNAMIAFAALKRSRVRCSIMVAGDDLLVACYDDFDLAEVIVREREFGILPEARKFSSYLNTSFISGIFLESRGRAFFTPSPGRLLHRLWWSVNPPSPRDLAAYQRGVALGLLPVCQGIPVLRVWLSSFVGSGRVGRSDKGYVFRQSDYGDADFTESFCRRYNLNEADILSAEAFVSACPQEPLLLVNAVLNRIVEVDEAKINAREALA